jgi:hypothetical protein
MDQERLVAPDERLLSSNRHQYALASFVTQPHGSQPCSARSDKQVPKVDIEGGGLYGLLN